MALALLFHLVALPFVAHDAVFHIPKHRSVALVATSKNQVQHARRDSADPFPAKGTSSPDAPTLPPEPKKPEPKEPDQAKGQVVSLGPSTDSGPPDKPTKYLSEHDSRVLKETRARETSAEYKNALSKLQKEGKTRSADERQAANGVAGLPGRSGQDGLFGARRAPKGAQADQRPRVSAQDALRLRNSPDGTVFNHPKTEELPGAGQRIARAERGAPAPESAPGVENARPGLPGRPGTLQTLSLADPNSTLNPTGPLAGGPAPDDLRDVEDGEGTFLNARGFKYASYYNRVKEAIARVWERKVQDEVGRRDPQGRLYGYTERRTVVAFTLDRDGSVGDLKVTHSSGVEFLDEVAVETFRIVQRFPNPPPGLMNQQGHAPLQFSFSLLPARGFTIRPAYLPPTQN